MSKLNNKGFTLVEIIIVLAIAALVLAGILLAVRGAQESRRDSARRDAAGQIGALLEESAGNHQGAYPGQANGDTTNNFTAIFQQRTQDPLGPEFAPTYQAAVTPTCPAVVDPNVTIQIAGGGRQWAVCMGLESGDTFRAAN